MPSIGIGIDQEQVRKLMKELCIKPDRESALKAMIEGYGNSTPTDDLQRVIAYTTKANELAFLTFMLGLMVGSHSVVAEIGNEIPNIIKKSMMVGAQHSEEIKELMNDMDGEAPAATAAPAKKKPDQTQDEERMYG
jgi:hypothetical protein